MGPSVSETDGALLALPVTGGSESSGANLNGYIAATGTEHTSKTPENTRVPGKGGAESGALDPELQLIIDAWASLTPDARAVVVSMVRSLGAVGEGVRRAPR